MRDRTRFSLRAPSKSYATGIPTFTCLRRQPRTVRASRGEPGGDPDKDVRNFSVAQLRAAPRIALMCRRSNRLLLTAASLAMFLAACGLAWAQAGGSGTGSSQPPFDLADPSIVEAGSRLLRANCTHYCHNNPEGRAARAPALRGRSELSPEFTYQRIIRGAPPMPANGTTLSAEQIWTLVVYIESLAKAKD